ncbi:MAG: hypothetical protein ACD_54C00527G0001 [uncultured bacterium]|nr:MAG: hypothetical protein ACD_54C00527G0001 [uncultured bacterium]
MRSDAGLVDLVHLAGADLHLDPLAVAARHRGMDRAIAVGFRLAQVILEPPRHRPPALVDHAQNAVTIGDRGADDAETVDVGQPRKRQILFLHLAPDRVGFLGAAINIGVDLHLFQLGADIGGDLMHHITRFALQGEEAADDGIARLGVEHAERKVFQFFAHPLHTHATRQRRIDFHGFARLLRLLFRPHRLDGAHVVQPVGQLDQNHPQVFRHCHEQFAEVFRLLRFGRRQLQIGQLGDAIDQFSHLFAEQFRNLGIGGLGVFDGVMQQRGDDGGIIQLLFGQNGRNRHGMRKIRLARLAKLPFVHRVAIGIGAADQVSIATRIVILDKGDEVFNVDHHRPTRLFSGLKRAPDLQFALGFHQRAQQLFF